MPKYERHRLRVNLLMIFSVKCLIRKIFKKLDKCIEKIV